MARTFTLVYYQPKAAKILIRSEFQYFAKWKKSEKSTILKISSTFILHNNNAKKLFEIKKIANKYSHNLSIFYCKWIYWLFRIHMNFIQFFFTFLKIPSFEKNYGDNRRIFSSITRKILECHMKSCYKNVFRICNVT